MRVTVLERLGSSWTALGAVLVSAVAVYVAVIVLTRLAGVRSLAKMSSFDFAATVAVGSTVSSAALGSTPLANGVLVLVMLFGMQYVVATTRRRGLLRGLADNAPILLMAGDRVLEGNLRHARVSREELHSQLRLAGVHRLDQVHAVVMETTGDLSVLRAGEHFDEALLAGVRGAEALR
jgi:uncharacterized membrane protein YcaP (DUF421 family)